MTFERSKISLAAEQNVNQHRDLWSPAAYADHLAEAKAPPKPVGKAQIALIEYLQLSHTAGGPMFPENALTDVVRHHLFRGMHFGKVNKAATVLAKKGLVRFDGVKLSLVGPKAAAPKAESTMAFLSRGGSTGQLSELSEGRSRSMRFVVHYKASKVITPGEWRARKRGQAPGMGKPTDANLAKHVKGLESSFKPGGVNERAGPISIHGAKIVNQLGGGETVATYGSLKLKESAMVSVSVLREDADSPEGVTGGFNRHQKLQSPDTRELVLKSRATEIEAFANDRGYDPRIVFAIAEVSSRMGRVPDLRQYGVYGEEAKAIRHFIAGDVLNIAIEDVVPSASILLERRQ